MGKLCILACGAGERFADPEMEHEELTDEESMIDTADLEQYIGSTPAGSYRRRSSAPPA